MINYPTVKDNLVRYIEAGFPILYINTFEEAKADRYIAAIPGYKGILEWNGSDGFVDFKTKAPLMPDMTLEKTLAFLKTGKELHRKLLVIKDAADQLNTKEAANTASAKTIALLKEIAGKIRTGLDAAVVIVSPTVHIPQDLEKMTTVLELGYPDEKEISGIIDKFMDSNEIPAVHAGLKEEMSRALKGLTEFEIEDLLRLAISEDGELTGKAIKLILDQKQQIIMKAGILEMIPLKESIEDIGGLENLKEWLHRKAKVFKNIRTAEEFGVSMPKGVMIAGMPGCGKSLCAKAAGKLFDVPLLRLDMGRLMGKYVGESEENMRKAILLAEAISPCVLWVDELEKSFAGVSGGGSEVTTRLFGTFLTWMQEKKSAAFVLATANKITELPPELLRKGRFDEIFYVALPNPEERKKIFEIKIEKSRKQDLGKIDIAALIEKTNGYTGADIEGVVCESVESVFVKDNTELTTNDIQEAIKNTHSLSEIMKDELAKMGKEYEERKFKKASK
jgi:SpoVK/Ycf46/Vps4 family AAA+-type ATPase